MRETRKEGEQERGEKDGERKDEEKEGEQERGEKDGERKDEEKDGEKWNGIILTVSPIMTEEANF